MSDPVPPTVACPGCGAPIAAVPRVTVCPACGAVLHLWRRLDA